MEKTTEFNWKCQPEAEAFIVKFLDQAIQKNAFISALEKNLQKQTSSRFFDWLDHIIIGNSEESEKEIDGIGFVLEHATSSYRIFHHPGAQLPRIVMKDYEVSAIELAIQAESIAQFLLVRGMSGLIEGSPFSGFRRCSVANDNDTGLWVIERRGVTTIEPIFQDSPYLEKYLAAKEKWMSRPRNLENEEEGMVLTIALAQELVAMLNEDLAAWIVLEGEREYWQARNTAGQIQKMRQDRLGMGWANHDHHTFRSSRKNFTQLVRLFEILGFHCRERFYAGQEAGWGAQIMENPRCRLILFLDVDLAPDEVQIDFAHHPLSERDKLGTIGLWCALHGDSILKAGMHHLEAQFLFENLAEDLAHQGIRMMDPFSSFPYLKQAFTQGEMWPVEPRQVEKLLEKNLITKEQSEKFISKGAVGSHLENLQRREGYKGFNQKNVSLIIKKTDPRYLQPMAPMDEGHA